MKKTLILLAAICLCGCCEVETSDSPTKSPTNMKYFKHNHHSSVYTIDIEGHIYVVLDANFGGDITHAEHCPCKMK